MKSKGFTLIELLAVIVILAIIALIATPIVLNIIKGSKESETIREAEYYLNAVELAVARNRLDNIKEGTYNILSNGNICNQNDITNEVCNEGKEITIEVSGEIPDSGIVTITNGKIVDINLTYDGKTVVKEGNKLVIAGESNNNNDNDTNTDNNIPKPVSFEADDWSTIIANVKAGNTDKYEVGAEKEITLTSTDDDSGNADGFTTGTYTVRLANKTTNDSEGVCANSTYSQTACGFVIEFVDIITTHNMNPAGEYNGAQYINGWSVDGWPASNMRQYVTPVYDDNNNALIEGSGTIYNALPEEVRTAIIDTRVVSGYEGGKSANYTSTDKLYLLSAQEVWGSNLDYDTANAETRQLDYYKDVAKVTSSSYSGAIKYLNGTATGWWLRSAFSNLTDFFYSVSFSGSIFYRTANDTCGVAVAFRLG